MFETNLGPIDRTIRVLAGLAWLAFWTGPWGYLGLVPLLTGAAGYCPLYAVFHISSCGSFHRDARQA